LLYSIIATSAARRGYKSINSRKGISRLKFKVRVVVAHQGRRLPMPTSQCTPPTLACLWTGTFLKDGMEWL
jgi:hypothetical protein